MMMKPLSLLALALLAAACDGSPHAAAAPAPAPVARTATSRPAATPPAETAPSQPGHARVAWSRVEPEPEPAPSLDPAGVLDEEERRLLEADDATLTKEERVDRAQAQRKLVLADPEHPLHRTVAAIEADVASGRYAAMAQDMWTGQAAFPDRDDLDEAPPADSPL